MCGVPHHALESYVARLIAAGKKVAIAEQTEAPQKGKTLVARKIVRVITPGTLVDPDRLDARQANDLAAIVLGGDVPALAYLDLSTGEFSAIRLDGASPAEMLSRRPAKELVAFPSEREPSPDSSSLSAATPRSCRSSRSEVAARPKRRRAPRGALPDHDARRFRPASRGTPRRRGGGRPRLRALDAEGRLRPRHEPQDGVGRRRARRRRRDAGTPRAVPLAPRRGPDGDSPLRRRPDRDSVRRASPAPGPGAAAGRDRGDRRAPRRRRGARRPRRRASRPSVRPSRRSRTSRGSWPGSPSGARRPATSPA